MCIHRLGLTAVGSGSSGVSVVSSQTLAGQCTAAMKTVSALRCVARRYDIVLSTFPLATQLHTLRCGRRVGRHTAAL